MLKVLFLIHDLGQGGAEKVLVNLVNNMDRAKFDITVMSLFGGGVNEQFLAPHIRYQAVFKHPFPGNSHVMKLFSPKMLHRWFIKERYDIEISYLEGPSARIISGCPNKDTKLVSWIHSTMATAVDAALGYASIRESQECYSRMDRMVFVSQAVQASFLQACPYQGKTAILYNTNETESIRTQATETAALSPDEFCWCAMGKLVPVKGFDRLIRIQKRLLDDGYKTHLYFLGNGPLRSDLEKLSETQCVSDTVSLLGYQTNPYKYVANCDLFVCSSHSEGFSTAATEALIVGTPVCTVDVSGMKEMLGENNEWGIVTENNEEALYEGIKKLLDNPEMLAHYKEKAAERGKMFRKENTVAAVETMLLNL